ncbi:Flagellar P-ring protein precursor [Phycisphaerae bacterium RAS2]|nr:Flagellar P-ring protein precursor [Phycisphaerae bacterium RAS2]
MIELTQRAAGFSPRGRSNGRDRFASTHGVFVIAALLLFVTADVAQATRIADVTHLQGRRENRLLGYGLVIGLPGTGDGGKYLASVMQLQAMLAKFEIPVPAAALADTKNVAIVMVEATLPDNGVREGDRIDVRVNSTGSAKSLMGGYLVPTPLQGPGLDRIFAFASGSVRLTDPAVKTSGLVVQGATMEADVIHNYMNEASQITLVIEDVHASHALASVIAQMINESVSEVGQTRRLAEAIGPKNVVVTIPEEERDRPATFIGRIESTELLMPPGEARIVINRKTQTIAIGDGVEVGPAVISHNGMSIMTRQPPPVPTPDAPVVGEQFVAAIQPGNGVAGANDATRAKLQELVDSLNALGVPAKDIIEIVENLHRLGKVTGKLVVVE